MRDVVKMEERNRPLAAILEKEGKGGEDGVG
jgi:hypothetical protein